jgi:hypothetical protein
VYVKKRLFGNKSVIKVKVKVKVVPVLFLTEHHTMKAYWGSGGIAPCII